MATYNDLNRTSGTTGEGDLSPLDFQGVTINAGPAVATGNRSTTQNVADPMQKMLMDMILKQSSSTGAIPPQTLAALQKFTANPSAAAEYFPQLAAPLLSSLRPSEEREVTDLTDMFRKAGGTSNGAMQSGAFAQAGRQLIGDQAGRRQEMLAKNYVPLTDQLSGNMTNAIGLGLKVPQATSEMLKPLAGLVGSLNPKSTSTESVTVSPGPTLSPQVVGQQVAGQNAQDQAQQNQWYDWWNS